MFCSYFDSCDIRSFQMQWSLKIMCWLLPRAWRLGSQSKPHLPLIFFPCVTSSSTILQGEATTWFGISSWRLAFHFSEEESIALLETRTGLPSPVCLPPSGLIVKYLGTKSSEMWSPLFWKHFENAVYEMASLVPAERKKGYLSMSRISELGRSCWSSRWVQEEGRGRTFFTASQHLPGI